MRRHGLFRRFYALEVEEQRWNYRPMVSGWSPSNWVREYRWRPATLAETLTFD